MRSLILSLCLAVAVFATSESALNSNKLMDTCEDCQSMIDRFITASKDTYQIEELKSMLRVGCDRIKYVEECKHIVKNLETLVRRMQPYIKDRHAVCRKLQMCDSVQISDVARLFLLVVKKHMNVIDGAKDNVCAECQMAATGISKTIGNMPRQISLVRYVKKTVCRHLGAHADTCRAAIDEMVPLLFAEMEAMFQDSTTACEAIGMCKTSGKPASLKESGKSAAAIGAKLWKDAPTIETRVGHVRMNCFECEVIMEGVVLELQSDKTSNGIGGDIRDGVCPKLPQAWLVGCDDFLTLYGPTVVHMTTRQFDAKGLCKAFLKTCESTESEQLQKLTSAEKKELSCEACQGTVAHLRTALSQSDIQTDVISSLQSYACKSFPETFAPLCENLISSFVPKTFNKMVEAVNDEQFCAKRVHAC